MRYMFYFIDQPRIPSFSIWLVKTKSKFIFGSVETGLGKRTLVIAVINIDVSFFFGFFTLTCHLKDAGIDAF